MKTFLLIASFICLNLVLSGQIAYYSAIDIFSDCVRKDTTALAFKKDAESLQKLSSYLKDYLPEEFRETTQDADQVFAFFSGNPFFGKELDEISGASSGFLSGRISNIASSVGNLNVTNFADGLAKFLVARAKEELNVAFFTKLQDFLKDYPEVKVVFPNTHDFLDDIYAYQYAAMLPALRAGFQLDMNNFSENLIKLRERSSYECIDSDCPARVDTIVNFLNHKVGGRGVMAALLTSHSIMNGVNAAEILNELTVDRIVSDHHDNLSNSVHLANLLSNSLRSKEPNAIWVNKGELTKLISNRMAFRIYLGLLYALDGFRSQPITFTDASNEITLGKLLEDVSSAEVEINKLRQSISTFGSTTAEISSLAKSIVQDENNTQQGTILTYANYARSISDMLKQGFSLFKDSLTGIASDIQPFLTIIDDAVDACYDVKAQNYGSLVLHTSDIMAKILRDKYTYKDDYIKYGSFMAGIIEADNSDEVKAAIEAAVLPVGSSSIKRETISNISLNGYIGPMVGYEYLGGLTADQWAPVFGVTAPVGVAFSWGRLGNGSRTDPPDTKRDNGKTKGGKSFTLFVPVIDVGSIATFRLGDESSNVAAEIKLENIISPGLYAYYGLGKLPISIGLGGQIGPQLREINATEINVDKNFYVRFGLNVVVDIPFFNFYTKN